MPAALTNCTCPATTGVEDREGRLDHSPAGEASHERRRNNLLVPVGPVPPAAPVTMVYVAVFTGLRVSEVIGLRNGTRARRRRLAGSVHAGDLDI